MFKLPPLSYEYNALEPYIDEETMKLHHDKHHATYVEKLNAALQDNSELLEMDIETLVSGLDKVPESVRMVVTNNAGGHVNHTMFWEILAPGGSKEPSGDLLKKIEEDFGGFSEFKKQFSEKALAVFGSGWVFLIMKEGKLHIKRKSFQNSPLMDGFSPIMGIDVWEHAYYLKYQNKRAEYVEAIWNVFNWDVISRNFAKASEK